MTIKEIKGTSELIETEMIGKGMLVRQDSNFRGNSSTSYIEV